MYHSKMSLDVFEHSLPAGNNRCDRYEESDRSRFETYHCQALTGIIKKEDAEKVGEMVCAGFGRVRLPVSFTSHDDPPYAITWMHHWKRSFGASALYRITSFTGDRGEHPPLLCANGHQWRDKGEWTQTTVGTRSCTYPDVLWINWEPPLLRSSHLGRVKTLQSHTHLYGICIIA